MSEQINVERERHRLKGRSFDKLKLINPLFVLIE